MWLHINGLETVTKSTTNTQLEGPFIPANRFFKQEAAPDAALRQNLNSVFSDIAKSQSTMECGADTEETQSCVAL